MEQRIHILELDSKTHALKIEEIVRRMDSYHYDNKQKLDKLEDKIDMLPSEDRIMVLFKNEGEKLAGGLIKKDDEQQKKIDDIDKNLSNQSIGWKIGFALISGFMIVKDWILK